VERVRAVEGVRSTESFIYISRHKLNYAWAADLDDDPVGAADVEPSAEDRRARKRSGSTR
jgi:hypothetical protein